jgi:hypothetical protein
MCPAACTAGTALKILRLVVDIDKPGLWSELG